jgi:L-alanine-DL-glutamate epimerase-like enolase superfamily enzyme
MKPGGATAGMVTPLGGMGQPATEVRSRTTEINPTIEGLEATAYEIPTDQHESDGTYEWDSTTVVVVEAFNGRERGIGYTYGDRSVATLIESKLADIARGEDAMRPSAVWAEMRRELRNAGQQGVGAMAISAVDIALWDLKARLLGVPLADALPRLRDSVPIYGSGGFTSYSLERIREQLGGWVEQGIARVKMKVSREPERDPERLDAARQAIGDDAELYVDSNGAFQAKQALRWAERFSREWGVSWYEEPVSSADFEGLRLVRDAAPLDVAAGEYAYVLADFRNLVGCVDCLQADVTRCGGITGLLRVNGLAAAHALDVSGHCAPQLSAHALCAVDRLRHLEYFHDHVRLESMLFDGVLEPEDGALRPDRSRAGNGLELKREEAVRWAA